MINALRYIAPALVIILAAQGMVTEAQPPVTEGLEVSASEKGAETQDNEAPAEMTRELLYNKILGMLVGSAIGDALGAPTEMWPREKIQAHFDFVVEMRDTIRVPSPEGSWALNAPPGTTTDDTRWKKLIIEYLASETDANPRGFATFINQAQEQYFKELQAIQDNDLDAYVDGTQQLLWLKEWVAVGQAYLDGDIDRYARALDRFYGGDLACAGLLYSPVVGTAFPGAPEIAYTTSYNLSIFDMGYARDISAVAAAMTAAAMVPEPEKDDVLEVLWQVDPHGYFESRLIGRIAYRLYEDARLIVHEARQAGADEALSDEAIDRLQLITAYELLDKTTRQHAFHAAEVHLVNLTAILYADWDFAEAMRFVISYGRDNDTTASVTGAILGAYHGMGGLPQDWAERVLERNREMGIDLEELAGRLTDVAMSNAAKE